MNNQDFLGRILGQLLKIGLALMKIVPKRLAKSVLIPLELIGAGSATDAAIQNQIISYDYYDNLK